jgi:hypothetical protein
MPKKVQVELSEPALERIQTIQAATEATSAAEVIRNALQFFDWYVKKRREGYDVLLAKDDEEIHVELPGLVPVRHT